MSQFWNKIIRFFSNPPKLLMGFYISSEYICGVRFSAKEKNIVDYCIHDLPKGVIHPSFNEKNIVEKEILKEIFSKAIHELNISQRDIVLIFPEISQKTFTFSFNSLPASPQEKEQIIRFRIKKKMPFLPDDAKISYDLIQKDSEIRSVVLLARTYIIKEYEEFFQQFGLKIRNIVPPYVGLMNLLSVESNGSYFLLNIEEDSFSLTVFKDSDLILYRQKNISFEQNKAGSILEKTEDVFQEVENTLNFIDEEDRKKIKYLIRIGIDQSDKFLEKANKKFGLLFDRIGSYLEVGLNQEETERLSPIIGMLL